jgi:hypothetical protein
VIAKLPSPVNSRSQKCWQNTTDGNTPEKACGDVKTVRRYRVSKNYNKLWPEQAKAKWLVQTHVKRGKIIKPEGCERCGKPFPPAQLQAHHKDYAFPLDVSWYCSACHKEVHKELGVKWK